MMIKRSVFACLLAGCLLLPAVGFAGDAPLLMGVVHYSYPYYHPTERYTLAELRDYVLPCSDRRLLTPEDMAYLSPEMLGLAQREIYARRGVTLTDHFERLYFYFRGWYRDEKAGPAQLSAVEKQNILLLRNEESAQKRRWTKVKKQTAEYDIDGDGEKDDISFTVSGADIRRATLRAGKAKLSLSTDHVDGFIGALWIANIDETDKVREIAIAKGSKGGTALTFYRLHEGKLQAVGTIDPVETDVNRSLDCKLDGQGTVTVRQKNAYSDISAAWTNFTLGAKGFAASEPAVGYIENVRLLPATAEQRTALPLYAAPQTGSAQAATVSPADDVALICFTEKSDGVWWEILRIDGARGWAKESDARAVFTVVNWAEFNTLPENQYPADFFTRMQQN